MEFVPPEGYPPAPSGFLDAETAWPILLDRGMGLTVARPDLLALLRWSIDAGNVRQFREIPEDFREAATAWLTDLAGPAAAAALDCVAAHDATGRLTDRPRGGRGLSSQAKGRLEKAAGKIEERYLGGATLADDVIARWAAAATEVVRLQITDPR